VYAHPSCYASWKLIIVEKWKYESCVSWRDNPRKIVGFFSVLEVGHRILKKIITSMSLFCLGITHHAEVV
jgi:hypothetical protein